MLSVSVVTSAGDQRTMLAVWGVTAADGTELCAVADALHNKGVWVGGPCALDVAGLSGKPGATADGRAILIVPHPRPHELDEPKKGT